MKQHLPDPFCNCGAQGRRSEDGTCVTFWCRSFIGTHDGATIHESRECLTRQRDRLRVQLDHAAGMLRAVANGEFAAGVAPFLAVLNREQRHASGHTDTETTQHQGDA